jgi:hypothetical protein
MKNSAPSLSLPNPTPWLFLAAAALAWVALQPDGRPPTWLLAIVLLPAALAVSYVLARRSEVAAMVLIGVGAASRFSFEMGGLKVRAEYIVIGLLCLALPFLPKNRAARERWILPDYLLLAYVACNLLSSLVMSISPIETLKWAMEQAVAVAAYFLIRVFVRGPQGFVRAVHFLAAVGAIGGFCGLLSFYSNRLFGTTFGVDVEQYVDIPGTYGTMFEANILGAFCAAGLMLALVLYCKEHRRLFLVEAALAYGGVMVSVSRAVMLTLLIVAAVTAIVLSRAKLLNWRGVRNVAATLLMTTLLLMPAIAPLYLERFSSLDTSDVTADPETSLRLVTMAVALQDIADHPVLGSGTASFQLSVTGQQLGLDEKSNDVGMWIGNFELRVLHDTGAVGSLAFHAFFIALVVLCWKRLRQERNVELLALLLSGLVYCFTFQATEGTLLAFSWVHLGLLACAVAVYTPRKEERVIRDGVW